MEIRKDFKPAELFIERLLKLAQAFEENDLRRWPHLKNHEDFDRIYSFQGFLRDPIEDIYKDGRDCAIAMSDKLRSFNYADDYPTLSAFVDSFECGWVYQVDLLLDVCQKAESAAASAPITVWAVGEMIDLFKDQLKMLEAVKNTLSLIKQTHLYKMEKGIVPVDKLESIHINAGGRVLINSTDNSTNITVSNATLFVSMQDALEKSQVPTEQKMSLKTTIDAMERAQGTSEFIAKYREFMSEAANHITVFGPYLASLSALLG